MRQELVDVVSKRMRGYYDSQSQEEFEEPMFPDSTVTFLNSQNKFSSMTGTMTKRRYGKKPCDPCAKKKRRVPRTLAAFKPEIKHYDSLSNIAVPNTGVWALLQIPTYPNQGLDFTDRIGRKIYAVRVELFCQLQVTAPAGVYLGGDTVSCEVWHDKETKGATAAPADIYNTGFTGGYRAPPNASNLTRFKRKMRMQHLVQVNAIAAGPVATAVTVQGADWKRIPLGYPIHFTGNAGTVADIMDNGIIMSVCSLNGGAVPAYNLSFTTRFWYYDV